MGINYRDAGVDVEAGYEAVRLMKQYVNKTHTPNVIGGLGGFGGMFQLDTSGVEEPVLVAATDGVGTKLKIAFLLDRHDTIGIDCVAMCVNDLICQGARPLFFLDYIATGKLLPEQAALIVKGVAEGCLQSGCALIGGETAEMPGFYQAGEYDVAGFAVGLADRKKLIDGSKIEAGDSLIGLASSGVHSNGFSLVRKLLAEENNRLSEYDERLGSTIGEALLTPTRIYVKGILELLKHFTIKGLSHITGGGFIENIPRMLPAGLSAELDRGSWPVLPVFSLLQEAGQIAEMNMFNTFNMGIGMVLACEPAQEEDIIAGLKESGYPAYPIGRVKEGQEGMVLI
ncbi:MAG: phosphoribosylformylglycinamidine cyclo-ligase [Caldicoprobacterales bacterium]|jgi:phosphoribosylformylglycinamidine cyclo-ligase|nr:phosphoribosylformylglycinamidine cyclo-ligase [Clostridiales bacterium]